METILIIGILFFAFMTIYNLRHYVNKKSSLLPAIFGFLMALSVLLILFDQLLLGSLVMVAIFFMAIASSKTIYDIRRTNVLKEMRKIDDKKPSGLKDFLGLRFWGKMALKYGARKAALFYSLFQVSIIGAVLSIPLVLSPDFSMDMTSWSFFVITIFGIEFFEFYKIFQEFCDERERVS